MSVDIILSRANHYEESQQYRLVMKLLSAKPSGMKDAILMTGLILPKFLLRYVLCDVLTIYSI